MPRRIKTLQTNFSSGEIAPELGMRQDTEQYRNGAKSLTNMRCLIGGGVTRRPGTWWLAELTQDALAVEFIVNQSTKYVLCFSAGRVDIFLVDGREITTLTPITGCPWTGTIWSNLDWTGSGNTLLLAHQDMPTQVLTRTSGATWSRSAFTFFAGAGGRTEQPYYNVTSGTTTLTPSALTGAITLTLSASFFTASRIGQKIRYLGREITITGVTNGTLAAGTVVELLPPTQTLTVTSSAKFATGQLILGDTSGAKGLVTGIPDATHITAVIIQGLTPFEVEDLIGPDGVTAISAVAAASPAAVTDWDEQLFHAVNGYPSCLALHRNRLLFAGHPQAPNALIASRLGNLFSFDTGDATDADAIFEFIGDASSSSIVQLHSAEQLLIATDHGLYYCPESQANPFRPTSVAFFPFGSSWPITPTAKARAFDDGVLFVSGSLLIMARPTGNLTQSWAADEVSLLSSHILDTPPRLGVVSNFHGGPERYALLVNADGTMAPLQLVSSQKIRNMTPWTFTGTITSVVGMSGDIYATTARPVNGSTRYFLEVFDQDVTLDLAREMASLASVTGIFGTTDVSVVVGNYSLGTYPLTIGTVPDGPYTVGVYYDTRTEPMPPAIDGGNGPIAGQNMRILESLVFVLNSARFAQNGYELAAYQVTDDLSAAPPLRGGPQRFQFLDWVRDPTVPITQPDPLPLTILAVKSEVAY